MKKRREIELHWNWNLQNIEVYDGRLLELYQINELFTFFGCCKNCFGIVIESSSEIEDLLEKQIGEMTQLVSSKERELKEIKEKAL